MGFPYHLRGRVDTWENFTGRAKSAKLLGKIYDTELEFDEAFEAKRKVVNKRENFLSRVSALNYGTNTVIFAVDGLRFIALEIKFKKYIFINIK